MLSQNQTLLHIVRSRLKQYGWFWIFCVCVKRVALEILWILSLPLGVLVHLLGFRRLYVQTWHIGHLAADVDTFIKEQRLGLIRKRHHFFITARTGFVANQHLLNYWKKFIPVVLNPILAWILELMSRRWVMREDLSRYISKFFGTQEIFRINTLWDNRPPVLVLNAEDEVWGKQQLAQLGMKENQWFVCVHVREGSYMPKNEIIQRHRNASIANAIPAMKEIVRRGGVCVRMGDPGMTPLPEIAGVIDYARHPLKSERLDVVLCAKARFFLGDTSGLFFVSTIFGVPVANANMIPVETLGVRECDLSIPKLLWSESLERYLTFDELLSSEAGGYFFTQQYEWAKIRADENTSEDLSDLAAEMLDRLDGQFTPSAEQEKLHAVYLALFKPGHYSYGTKSRVCLRFIQKHRNLLNYAG